MSEPTDPKDVKIADLERELKFARQRIDELNLEVDANRQTLRGMEDYVQERDAYLETFITAFGIELGSDDVYRWGEFVKGHNQLCDDYNSLVTKHNKLVRAYNAIGVELQPVGRPIAASQAQQRRILMFYQSGWSSRRIAETMTLSRRTVTTIIGKANGTDRTTERHRERLGLETILKRKDWRRRSRDSLPKQATALRKQARDLLKEAKG